MVTCAVILVVETDCTSLGPYEQLVSRSDSVRPLKVEFVAGLLVVSHVEPDFVIGA